MRTALANKIADRIDNVLVTEFAAKRATQAEADLQRRLGGLFDEALSAAITQMQAKGVFGAADIPVIDGIMAGLTPDMTTQITFVNEQFLDPRNRFAAEKLRELAFTASERTIGRARANVGRNLEKSFREGLGIAAAARNLRRTFRGLKDHELKRIARTETHNAQMGETNKRHQESDVIQAHEWITSLDGRQRDSHGGINGEIVRVGGTFSNGLKYPGDPNGKLDEIINCRCRLAPYFPPQGSTLPASNGPWRKADMIRIKDGLEDPLDDESRALRDRRPSTSVDEITEATLMGEFRNPQEIEVGNVNKTLFWEGDITDIIQKAISGEAGFMLEDLGIEGSETLASRERAAFILDRLFGFNNIPLTILRDLEGEESMVQQWITGAEQGFAAVTQELMFELFENNSLEQVQVMDYLMFNYDRHGGNFLIKDGKLYAIDNGYSFPAVDQAFFGNAFTDNLAEFIDLETYMGIMDTGAAQSTIDAIEDLDLAFAVSELKKAGLGSVAIDLFESRYQNLIQNISDPDWFFNNVIMMNIDTSGNPLSAQELKDRLDRFEALHG